MNLYVICSHGIHDYYRGSRDIVPLYDSDTGAPSVFVDLKAAEQEVKEINEATSGGYFVVPFEPEDEEEERKVKPMDNC